MLSRVVTDAISRASATLDRGVLRLMERQMRRGVQRPPENAGELLMQVAEHYGAAENLGWPSPFFAEPPPIEARDNRMSGRAGSEQRVRRRVRRRAGITQRWRVWRCVQRSVGGPRQRRGRGVRINGRKRRRRDQQGRV